MMFMSIAVEYVCSEVHNGGGCKSDLKGKPVVFLLLFLKQAVQVCTLHEYVLSEVQVIMMIIVIIVGFCRSWETMEFCVAEFSSA